MSREEEVVVVKHKLNKKKLIIIILTTLLAIILISVFARYVLIQEGSFFNKTEEFYFNSDKLSEENPLYRIENWSGVDDYTIIVNVNSNRNNIQTAPYEINYEISYTCSDNVLCELSKTSGTIPEDTDSDTFSLRVIPNTDFEIGDIVNINIEAAATEPYEKTISADFQIEIGQEKITYEIVDNEGSPVLDLNITNTLSYYIIAQSFGSYLAGDRITRDTYLNLQAADQEKCYSSIVTLQFNPDDVILDMTNQNYLEATNVTRVTRNGHQYINGITFKVDAITGTRVRFYKVDKSQNYTYPNSNNNAIITLTTN